MIKKENDKAKSTSQDLSYSNESFHEDKPFCDVVEELKEAKASMNGFIELLGDKCDIPISDIFFKYCGKYRNLLVSAEQIKNLVQKRIQRMLKNRKIKRNWNDEDSKIIIWTVSKYIESQGIQQIKSLNQCDWKNIASYIPGATEDSCMFKILSLKKVRLSEQKWTQTQSDLLFKLVEKHEKRNWKQISFELYKLKDDDNKIFRTSKQCKQHWTCYLNPELKKGPWTVEEDQKFLKYILENKGIKKWVKLSHSFPSRTQNALKNRYNLILERQRKNYPAAQTELSIISAYLKKLQIQRSSLPKISARIVQNIQVHGDNDIFEDESPAHVEKQIENPDTIQSKNDSNFSSLQQKLNFPVIYPVVMFVYNPLK